MEDKCAVCDLPECDHNFFKDDQGRYYAYYIPNDRCPECNHDLIAEDFEARVCGNCDLYLEGRFFKKTWLNEDRSML